MPTVFRLALATLAVLLIVPLDAEAQGLRDRIRQAAERQSGSSGGEDAPRYDPSRTSMAQDAEAAVAGLDAYAPLVYDGPFPPAVVLESVLSSFRMLPISGDLQLESFWIAFPPTRDADGNPVDYGAQMRMHVRLHDASGALLMDRYYAPRGGFDNRVFTQFATTGNPINRRSLSRMTQTDDPLVLTDPGAYRLEFLFDDRVFWEMPFEVRVAADDDPYATSGARYLLRGPWQGYGFLGFGELHTRAEPSSKLYWHAYTQLEGARRTREMRPLTLGLYRGGRLVGEARVEDAIVRDERQLEAWPLRAPGASQDLTREDLTDGTYEIRYGLGGEPVQVYPFEVRRGEIVPQGRQVREATDPTRFIEGLGTAWWIAPR
ncbi:MAG: hypothetical protein AAF845_11355 [Bacteroidota bacterium]